MKNLTLSSILFFSTYCLFAQSYYLSGVVTNQEGETVPGVNVTIQGTTAGVSTDFNGNFKLKIPDGATTIVFTGIGFKSQELKINRSFRAQVLNIRMQDHATELNAVQVVAEAESFRIEQKGYSVEAIETQQIKSQSLELNNVLGRAAGVRVRRSGGMGSDFNYSLNGMSGNAIRFFIDGIPMDYFGSSYSINNIPITLIERVDIYKGVVPVELGSDALGGAINLVTNQSISNMIAASYSFGSYNTHQASLYGQWRLQSGFTTKLSAFHTYSDNTYNVWGKGVHYADASTGYKAVEFTKENPAKRFNDDFQATTLKIDVGFSEVKWADQFYISLLATDQKKGIQTAQTMARVFGKVRYNEQVIMPNLSYQKKNLLTNGLDVNVFAGYSHTEAVLVDTSGVQYNWKGDSIGYRLSGGEMGYEGKSHFTLTDQSVISRLNTTYQLPLDMKLGFNYLYSTTRRTGEDPYSPIYRIPYLEPQNIGSHFAGLSLESEWFNEKLNTNMFLKAYQFHATINDYEYTDEYVLVEYKNDVFNWGGGLATSYNITSGVLAKFSLEQATRMPNAIEALGDGVTVDSNPLIKPERSFNMNFGAILGRFEMGSHHGVKIAINTFYRDVTDKLLFTVIDAQGNGEFRNIDKISGTGAEVDLIYDFDQKLKLTLNGSYQNYRNNLEFEEDGKANILYRDRMRNEPYILANAGLQYNVMNLIQKDARIFTYIHTSYVHKFFLEWPSLASKENKDFIPSQMVFDVGVGYTFPTEKVTVAMDISNLFNEQVYDNYLLQKPGRAIFLKINYQLKQ